MSANLEGMVLQKGGDSTQFLPAHVQRRYGTCFRNPIDPNTPLLLCVLGL